MTTQASRIGMDHVKAMLGLGWSMQEILEPLGYVVADHSPVEVNEAAELVAIAWLDLMDERKAQEETVSALKKEAA